MPKKLRFVSAYFFHYLRQYALVIFFGIITGSLIFIGRDRLFDLYHLVFLPTRSVGVEGLYTVSNLPSVITNRLSFGITTLSENDKPELSPLVVNIESQADHLQYKIHFRDDLFWQNGRKFKVSDLDLNIPGIVINESGSDTLDLNLSAPFAPLMSVLSKPLFLKGTLIGLGKYRVNGLTYQDGYYKTMRLSPMVKGDERLVYHFYSNSSDLYNAFKLGEVDEISTTTLDEQFNEWPSIRITPAINTSQYLAVFLNTEKFSNKQLRQALAYATPKSEDKNKRCLGPISPTSWSYNAQVKPYNYNPTRAKELIDKDIPAKIVLTITDRKLLSMAEVIKKSWEEILGTKVEVNIENQNVDFKQYDTLLTYAPIPNDPDQYAYWHSTQTATNITHLNNSRIDKLLEEGRQTIDQQERKKIYLDFQRYLLEESPAIFLEFPTTYNINRVK